VKYRSRLTDCALPLRVRVTSISSGSGLSEWWHSDNSLMTIRSYRKVVEKKVPQKSAKPKTIDTRQELAKLANVSHDTISKVGFH
jgi:hypothetical protein